jgi:hypothetical protein
LSNLPKPALALSTTIFRIVQPCGAAMRVTPKPSQFTSALAEWIVHPAMPLMLAEDPAAKAEWLNNFSDTVFTARLGKIEALEDGDDVCVFIQPEHVPSLIRRLQQLIK